MAAAERRGGNVALTKKEKRQIGALLAKERATGFLKGQGAALRAALEERARELLKDDLRAIRAILVSVGLSGAATEVGKADWAGRWKRGLKGLLLRAAKESTKPREEALGSFDPEDDPEAKDWFEGYVVKLADDVTETTKEKVTDILREAQRNGLSMDEAAGLIDASFDEISPGRARRIARTELGRASKGAAFFQAKRSGLAITKTRRSMRDDRVRDEHRDIDGETVPVEARYSNSERFCGELSINCRCRDLYAVNPR